MFVIMTYILCFVAYILGRKVVDTYDIDEYIAGWLTAGAAFTIIIIFIL